MSRPWNGMKWITHKRRLAIYLRDGLACCYCRRSITEEIKLTLDHFIPVSRGGSNRTKNLITSCKFCNDSRGSIGFRAFCGIVAKRTGENGVEMMDRIRRQFKRSLRKPLEQARQLLHTHRTASRTIVSLRDSRRGKDSENSA